jgi:hypothetical protein
VKVYVFPADEHGCGHYRMIWPAEALVEAGHADIEIIPAHRRHEIQAVMVGNRVKDVRVPDDADVIVLQRVTHRFLAQAIPVIRSKGIAVVIDIDDDLSRIHPSNPAFSHLHPRSNIDHSWHYTVEACNAATWVTLSTEALMKRYGVPGRQSVCKNSVHDWYFDIVHFDSDLIGWAGSLHSHPDDVPQLGTSIAKLMREGLDFATIGSPDGIRQALRLDRDAQSMGVVTPLEWPHYVAKIGIGLAPLAPSQFNDAKSWLKPLEYAATGVPCVISPRAEYRKIHALGVGLLAEDQKEWYRKIKLLARDPALREDLAARGREAVRDQVYRLTAVQWLEAWTNAYQLERRGASVLRRS